jgi:hypothetical protein
MPELAQRHRRARRAGGLLLYRVFGGIEIPGALGCKFRELLHVIEGVSSSQHLFLLLR